MTRARATPPLSQQHPPAIRPHLKVSAFVAASGRALRLGSVGGWSAMARAMGGTEPCVDVAGSSVSCAQAVLTAMCTQFQGGWGSHPRSSAYASRPHRPPRSPRLRGGNRISWRAFLGPPLPSSSSLVARAGEAGSSMPSCSCRGAGRGTSGGREAGDQGTRAGERSDSVTAGGPWDLVWERGDLM